MTGGLIGGMVALSRFAFSRPAAQTRMVVQAYKRCSHANSKLSIMNPLSLCAKKASHYPATADVTLPRMQLCFLRIVNESHHRRSLDQFDHFFARSIRLLQTTRNVGYTSIMSSFAFHKLSRSCLHCVSYYSSMRSTLALRCASYKDLAYITRVVTPRQDSALHCASY